MLHHDILDTTKDNIMLWIVALIIIIGLSNYEDNRSRDARTNEWLNKKDDINNR